jgi:hypothetical protein
MNVLHKRRPQLSAPFSDTAIQPLRFSINAAPFRSHGKSSPFVSLRTIAYRSHFPKIAHCLGSHGQALLMSPDCGLLHLIILSVAFHFKPFYPFFHVPCLTAGSWRQALCLAANFSSFLKFAVRFGHSNTNSGLVSFVCTNGL